MKRSLLFRLLLICSVFLAAGLLMFACNGGGGSSSSSAESGQVALLVTDATTDDFAEVNVTVQRITLLADESQVTIFSSSEDDGNIINLLELQNEATLFSISDNVPTGWYDKIRLEISQVELVKKDDGSSIFAELPANGKIDLNPRQPFCVTAGQTLLLQLDMDANKSIHVVETGANTKYQFRPVVFVDVLTEGMPAKLVRLEGIVQEVREDSFILCPQCCTQVAPCEEAACGLLIHISEETSIFDDEGEMTELASLQAGAQVQVIGRFRIEEPVNDGCRAAFDAFVVEIGTFLNLKGTVRSGVQQSEEWSSFWFEIADGQGIVGDLLIETRLSEGSKLFSSLGDPLELEDLAAGLEASVDGILVRSEDNGDFLKAALVILSDASEETKIEGTIEAIGAEEISISLEDGSSLCAWLDNETDFYRITWNDEKLEIEMIPFETLATGDKVELFGRHGDDCFEVDDLFVLDEG